LHIVPPEEDYSLEYIKIFLDWRSIDVVGWWNNKLGLLELFIEIVLRNMIFLFLF